VRFAVEELFSVYHRLQDLAEQFERGLEPVIRPVRIGVVVANQAERISVDRAPLASAILRCHRDKSPQHLCNGSAS
jgi:hypothetical protein